MQLNFDGISIEAVIDQDSLMVVDENYGEIIDTDNLLFFARDRINQEDNELNDIGIESLREATKNDSW